jgi:hypothetical protein
MMALEGGSFGFQIGRQATDSSTNSSVAQDLFSRLDKFLD